jgi:hypothetical protein
MREADVRTILLEYINLNPANILYDSLNQSSQKSRNKRTSAPVTCPSTVYPFPKGMATNSSGKVIV